MRTVKAATLVFLFVLIPHQAPFAESVDSTDESSTATSAESESGKSEQSPSADMGAPVSDSLVESAAPASVTAEGSSHGPERVVDADGYSWSGRSLK